jgi:hypothetical protein
MDDVGSTGRQCTGLRTEVSHSPLETDVAKEEPTLVDDQNREVFDQEEDEHQLGDFSEKTAIHPEAFPEE